MIQFIRPFVILILSIGFYNASTAQIMVNGQDINQMDIEYVELVGWDVGAFKKNLVVVVDYGQKTSMSESQAITGPDNKPQKFESMLGALNFMAKNGWEYVDAYLLSSAATSGSVYHYVLKRKH